MKLFERSPRIFEPPPENLILRYSLKRLCLLVVFSLLFSRAEGFAADRSPKLEVSSPNYQFGKVEEGEIVEAKFPLINTGNALLEIQRVVSSCGCTVAQLEKKALAPGESTELVARFDTHGFFGPKVKTVRLYTNESKNSSVLLTLRGEILRGVTVEPSRALFGEVLLGTSPEKIITVRPRKPGVTLGDAFSRSPAVEVVTERDGGGYQIRVRIRPNAPEGILRSTVIVPVKSDRESALSLPVFANVQGELRLSPTSLSFGLLEAPLAGPVSKKVELRNVGASPVKILSVESDSPFVLGEAREISPKTFELKVTLQPGATGVVRSQLSVLTDRPDKKTVVLPVSAVLAEKGE